jgi:O-antigen/teichoic acid export membrane protein
MLASLLRPLAAVLASTSGRRVRTLWSAEVVSLSASLLAGVVVARGLGATSYGRLALLTTFAGLIATFLDPRSGEVVTKYFGALTARRQRVMALIAVRTAAVMDLVAVLSASAVILLALPVARLVVVATWTDLLLASVSATLLAPVLTARATLAVLDRYSLIARLQVMVNLLRAVLASVTAVVTADVTLVLLALAFSAVLEVAVTGAAALVAVRTRHGRLARGAWTRSAINEATPRLRRFVLYSEATTFLGSITKFGDTLAVGALASAEQAGFYRLARSLTAPIVNITVPLQTVAYNRFVAVHVERGISGMGSVAVRATRLSLPLALALLVTSPVLPWLVVAFAGGDFRPAGSVAVILMIGAALALPFHWLRAYYLVVDRLRTFFTASIIVAAASAAGFVVGARAGGADGVAVARILLVSLLGSVVLLLPLLPRRSHS